MNFRDSIEQSPVFIVLTFLVIGFGAGYGANEAIQKAANQEKVQKGTFVELRENLADAKKTLRQTERELKASQDEISDLKSRLTESKKKSTEAGGADAKQREFLSQQAEKSPPYYGNSVDGNVRPQMEAYLDAFAVSDNPDVLREILALNKMIQEKANPDKPNDYFDADNSFRTALDDFLNRCRAYSTTGRWPK